MWPVTKMSLTPLLCVIRTRLRVNRENGPSGTNEGDVNVTVFSLSSVCFQSFQGSQGRAYLFNSVVNVGCGPAEERVLLTGLHAVADIYCENCKTTLGWKYEHAFESSQKYKEGKFIIELAHMIKDNGWE
ncbi:protein yippee-like 1 isoform X1 [Phyllopteryx taeniolatus]|uniref:protein yippee-like 1 isoform X1 n=1 Tax=Phyllopteryx taeniolatus TaxID=161469 RepID=UPI002AD3A775|nr:protein yippee-like 1 isoform X1 [Phyllopteryx taeniolatus]